MALWAIHTETYRDVSVALDRAMKCVISLPRSRTGGASTVGGETVSSTQPIPVSLGQKLLWDITAVPHQQLLSPALAKSLFLMLLPHWPWVGSEPHQPPEHVPVPELAQDRGEWHLPSSNHCSLPAPLGDISLKVFWEQLPWPAKERSLQIWCSHPLPNQGKVLILVQKNRVPHPTKLTQHA